MSEVSLIDGHIDDKHDEKKHGKWLPQLILGQRVWDCSECKTIGSPSWNWCPVCGADMRGETK